MRSPASDGGDGRAPTARGPGRRNRAGTPSGRHVFVISSTFDGQRDAPGHAPRRDDERVLARAAGHEHPDVVGLGRSSAAGGRRRPSSSTAPTPAPEVAPEHVRRACGRGRTGTTRRRVRVKRPLGDARRVLGAEHDEVLALADRRVVHAQRRHRRRDLVEDQRRVAGGLRVVDVVRALAAVDGDRARRVDAAAAARSPPTATRRGSRPRSTCTSRAGPWVAASPKPGLRPGDVQQDQAAPRARRWRSPGCRDRSSRPRR